MGKLADMSSQNQRQVVQSLANQSLRIALQEEAAHALQEDEPLKLGDGKREANKASVLAWEKACKSSCGFSLADFTVPKPATRLHPFEERYFVEWDWDHPGDRGRLRSCIKNASTNKTRFELGLIKKQGTVQRRAFHLFIDQCSRGWHAGVWLHHGPPRVRGFMMLDRCHTVLNIYGHGKAEAGVYLLQMQWTAALRALKGPFKSQKHGCLVKRLLNIVLGVLQTEDFMATVLVDEVARDLGMHKSVETDGLKFESRVWAAARDEASGNSTGAGLEKDRWWDFEYAFRQHKRMVTLWLLAILIWGRSRDRWKTLEQSPLSRFYDPVAERGAESPLRHPDPAQTGAQNFFEESSERPCHVRVCPPE